MSYSNIYAHLRTHVGRRFTLSGAAGQVQFNFLVARTLKSVIKSEHTVDATYTVVTVLAIGGAACQARAFHVRIGHQGDMRYWYQVGTN